MALDRRGTGERIARLALAVVALVLGLFSVTRSVAYSVQFDDPATAHALAPDDGRITALLVFKQVSEELTTPPPQGAADLAASALRQDPTAVPAVVTLGLVYQLRGQTSEARRTFAYAQRLSRRNLTAELWAIEDAVTRGDVASALQHYDIALRTSQGASDILFPVLAAAIQNPEVRTGLIKTLSQKSAWGHLFIDFVAARGPDTVAAARFFEELQAAHVFLPPSAVAAVVNRLIASNDLDAAWRFYSRFRLGVRRDMSRDPRFMADLIPSVLDWEPTNNSSISTSIQRGLSGNAFTFALPPTVGGLLLRQLQLLPPGRYRLDGHSVGINVSDGTRPYWLLACSDGRELGRVVIPNSETAEGRHNGVLTVPNGCPAQLLMLMSEPSDGPAGLSGQIDRVRLAPIG